MFGFTAYSFELEMKHRSHVEQYRKMSLKPIDLQCVKCNSFYPATDYIGSHARITKTCKVCRDRISDRRRAARLKCEREFHNQGFLHEFCFIPITYQHDEAEDAKPKSYSKTIELPGGFEYEFPCFVDVVEMHDQIVCQIGDST